MLKSKSDADGVYVKVDAKSKQQVRDELLALLISLEEDGFDSSVIIAYLGYKRYLSRKEHKDADHKTTE